MGKKPKKGGAVVDDWENDVEEMEKEAQGGDAPPKAKEAAPKTVDDLDAMWSDEDDKKKKKKGKKGKKEPVAEANDNEKAAEAGDTGNFLLSIENLLF